MRIWRKLCAWLLAVIMTACGIMELAPMEAYAAAASSTTTISNQYLQYTINRVTGGFSVDTLEGHPQKKYDDHLPLLYKESDEGMETSYVTLRIKEGDDYCDYIFGQDYSWLLGKDEGKLTVSEPEEMADAIVLRADWKIQGFTVTQQVALSKETTGNGNNTGNVGISYSIKNENGDAREAGLRVLLDTALSNEIDAPYILTDDINYSAVEKSYSGENVPSQFRGVDSLSSPSRMCYAILNAWEGREADRVIVGHWANLANNRYDYKPDPSCDFTNRSNKFLTADSALALYWSPETIASGEETVCQFLYGVGNFSSELSDKKVNINMTVGNVELNQNGAGYANDGIFEVEATIDNTVTGAETLRSAAMTLSLEDGLTLLKNAGSGFTTDPEITLGDIEPGKTVTRKFKIQAQEQPQITARAVTISLNTINQINEAASRYVVLPNALGGAAKVKFSGVTPDKIYTEGDRAFALTGEFQEFEALKGKTGWALELKSVLDGSVYVVDKKDISFDEKYKNINAIIREEMPVGMYRIRFAFENSDLKKAFGSELDSGLQLEISADPELKDPSYGIISLVRYGVKNEYVFVPFRSEKEYDAFLRGEEGAEIKETNRTVNLEAYEYLEGNDNEILLTLRGKLKQVPQADNSTYYIMGPAEDSNVTMNNCISCENNVELFYEYDADGYVATVKGEGDIRVINSISFWKKQWSIQAESGLFTTLEDGDNQLGVSLDGAAQMIQSIGGLIADLKYGVLTSQVLEEGENKGFGYGVSFGGSMSIPISITEADDDGKENGKKDDEEEDEYEPNDGNLLSAQIDSILYGEKSLKDNLNPTARGAKSDSGYIGTNVTVGVGLPENVMGKMVTNAKGAQATVHVDTIEGVYEVSAGMKVAIVECEGTIAFKTVEMKGVEVTLPDELAFAIKDGLEVPISPPTVMMKGIGGGISELADTIGGNYVSGLPPITIKVNMALEVVEVLEAEMEAQINAFGMSLQGEIEPTTKELKDVMTIEGGITVKWIGPFYLNIYGKVNVLDIIIGGASITVKGDYFRGYAFVALIIPESIPLVGGIELARIEAAVSSDYVGANVKILGIGLGVIYYFEDGDVNIGGRVDLGGMDEPEDLVGSSGEELVTFALEDGEVTYKVEDTLAIEEESVTSDGEEHNYTMVVGTNTHKLDARQVKVAAEKSSSSVFINRLKSASSVSNTNKTVWEFNPSAQDALLIKIPFDGDVLPKVEEVTLTDPNNKKIKLVEMDKNDPSKGNFLAQQIKNSDGSVENYLFISITEQEQLVKGKWELSVNNPEVRMRNAKVETYGVDNVPTLESVQVEAVEDEPLKARLSWTTSGSDKYSGHIACYLNTDKDIVKKMQEEAAENGSTTEGTSDLGIQIYEETLDSIKGQTGKEVELPEAIPDGDYYLITTLSVDKGGANTLVSAQPIKVHNPNLPGTVTSAELKAVGDGKLRLDITDSEENYNEYYVELKNNATQEVVATGFYDKESSVVFGPVIKAASVDDPNTPENEASPEERLETGKTYSAVVRTSRRETTEGGEQGVVENYEEIRYVSSQETKADAVYLPEPKPPVLVSVKAEGMGNASSDGKSYSKEKHIKAVYTFQEALKNFYASVDSMSVDVTSSDDGKVWTFETDVEDGTHFVDFVAVSKTGDTLKGDGGEGSFGFITDTEVPMLSIDNKVQESMQEEQTAVSRASEESSADSRNDGKVSVSLQTVMTDKSGKYTILGHTEPGVEARYSGIGTVDIHEDGSFQIDGTAKLGDDVFSKETITVEDKAGNENKVFVYISNGNLQYPEQIVLTNDGKEIQESDGMKTVKMKTGEQLKLKAVGYDKDGKEISLDASRLEWDTIYESNLVKLEDGQVTAIATGETAVRAVLPYAGIVEGENTVPAGPGDFVRIIIEEGAMSSVSFNGGGGIGKDPSSLSGVAGSIVTLPENPYVKNGKKFEGWSDGTKLYAEGAAFIVPSSGASLTAKWKGEEVVTPTPTETPEPTGVPTETPEPTGAPTETPKPTGAPTETPEPTGVPTETPEPTGAPTETPEPPEPTGTPVETPEPTGTPIETPEPTGTPVAPTKPKTPEVKVTNVTSTTAKVTWKGVSGAEKYRVYYRGSGEKWKRVKTVSAKTRSYTVTKLKSGKKYYFTVRAYANGVFSDYKKNVSKITLLKTPSVKAKATGGGKVRVSWSKVSGAKKYYVYYKVPGKRWKRVAEKSGLYSSFTIKNLKKDKTYLFTVKAVGKVGKKTIYSKYKTNVKTKVK